MYQMKVLRSELGDVYSVLVTMHKDLIASTSLCQWWILGLKYNYYDMLHPIQTEKKVEELFILEAKYGPISGYEPAINDVLKYLSEVLALQILFWILHTVTIASFIAVDWFNKWTRQRNED